MPPKDFVPRLYGRSRKSGSHAAAQKCRGISVFEKGNSLCAAYIIAVQYYYAPTACFELSQSRLFLSICLLSYVHGRTNSGVIGSPVYAVEY